MIIRTTGSEGTLPLSRTLEFAAPETGGLLEIVEEGKTLVALGTNFLDEQESDLQTRSKGEGGAYAARTAGSVEAGTVSDPLFWILLGTVVVAVLANWCLPGVERRIA